MLECNWHTVAHTCVHTQLSVSPKPCRILSPRVNLFPSSWVTCEYKRVCLHRLFWQGGQRPRSGVTYCSQQCPAEDLNYSWVVGHGLFFRELLPVGYYQSTQAIRNLRVGYLHRWCSGSPQMAQPEAYNGNHRPREAPVGRSQYLGRTSWCPQGHGPESVWLTHVRTSDGCRFPKQDWAWFLGVFVTTLVPYTLQVFRGWQTPCLHTKQEQFQSRSFRAGSGVLSLGLEGGASIQGLREQGCAQKSKWNLPSHINQ